MDTSNVHTVSPPSLELFRLSDDFFISNNVTIDHAIRLEVEALMGPRRDSLSAVLPLTAIYSVLLLSGFLGNVATCIVIVRNKYMHSTVNMYLLSLAVSDLLLLLLGLPQELYMLWRKYPYAFGQMFCVLRAFTSETCTNASILIITAFTVERYLAICHPLRAHTLAQPARALKVILAIWSVSALCSIPPAAQLGIVYHVSNFFFLFLIRT